MKHPVDLRLTEKKLLLQLLQAVQLGEMTVDVGHQPRTQLLRFLLCGRGAFLPDVMQFLQQRQKISQYAAFPIR